MEAKNLTRRQIQELIVEYTSAISKLEFQISTVQKTIEDLEKNLDEAPITASSSASSTSKPKARRGRPKKAATAKKAAAKKPAKRRGRPPKAKSTTAAATTTTAAKPKAKRGPGRPRKAAPTAKTKKAATTTKKTTAAKKATPAKKATTAKKATIAKKAPTAKKAAPAKKSAAKPKLVKKLEEKTSGYRLSDWDAHVIETMNKSGKVLTKNDICDAADKWAKGKKLGMDSKQVYTKVSNVLHKLTNKKNILNRFSNDKIKNAYGLSDWFTPQGNLRDEHLPA